MLEDAIAVKLQLSCNAELAAWCPWVSNDVRLRKVARPGVTMPSGAHSLLDLEMGLARFQANWPWQCSGLAYRLGRQFSFPCELWGGAEDIIWNAGPAATG